MIFVVGYIVYSTTLFDLLYSIRKKLNKAIAFNNSCIACTHNVLGQRFVESNGSISVVKLIVMLWIELLWPENPVNTCARHTETLDSSFDLIRPHQQCIPRSPPLEIKPAPTECRTETLPLSPRSTSHTNTAKSTRHGYCAANKPKCVFHVTSVCFTEDTFTSKAKSSQEDWNYHD